LALPSLCPWRIKITLLGIILELKLARILLKWFGVDLGILPGDDGAPFLFMLLLLCWLNLSLPEIETLMRGFCWVGVF